MTIRYQFSLNGTDMPVRDTWEEAARDAVHSGLAHWDNPHVLILHEDSGAKIRPVREAQHADSNKGTINKTRKGSRHDEDCNRAYARS